MTKRTSLQLLAPVCLAVFAAVFSLQYYGPLVGQLYSDPPEMLSPEGEAAELDLSRVSWSSTAVQTINVSWTVGSMAARGYTIIVRDKISAAIVRSINISTSALPDRMHPSHQMPIAGLVPYTEYWISVAPTTPTTTLPESQPNLFWITVKDMPAYELLRPENLRPEGVISSADAILQWSPLDQDPRTRKYKIKFRGPNDFDAFSISTSELSDIRNPSFSLSGRKTLTQGVEYQFSVQGEDMYGHQSAFSEDQTFIVNDDAFASQKSTLLAPLGEQRYPDRVFTWSGIEDAKNYKIEIRGTNNQESYTHTVESRLLPDANAPFTELRSFPISYGKSYAWSVQAFSQNDTPSQVSDMGTFSLVNPNFAQKKPVATGPTGTVPKAPMKFAWNKLRDAAGYNLSINVGDRNYLHRFNVSEIGDADTYAVAAPDLPIEYGTEYSFKVSAFDRTYVNSQYSDTVRFRTVPNEFLTFLPETISPRGQVANFNGVVSWKPVSGPVKEYRVSILSHDGSKAIFSYDKYISIFDLKDPVNPSFAVPGLTVPGTYSFTVQARNIEGYHSRISEPSVFTIAGSTTTLPVPSSNIAPVVTGPLSGSPEWSEVTWNAVPGASSYMLFVKDLTTGKEVTIVNRQVLLSELADRNAPSVRLGNKIQYAGIYKIWVRAVRDAVTGTRKTYSPWSEGFVYVPGIGTHGENINKALPSVKPVITGPVSPAPASPILSWQPVAGAGSYEVFIQNNSTGRIEKVLATDNTSMYYQPEYSYIAGGKYTAWIRAIGGGVFSAWSAAWPFTVGQ